MSLPNSFVTHLTGILSGDDVCELRPWLQARHNFKDEGKDWTKWRIKHTAMVQEKADELMTDGWTVRLESENYWRLKGETAMLSGKPDIVAERDGVFRIVDTKGGEPENKHRIQVAVYLIALPLSWKRQLQIHGVIAYADHEVYVERDEAEHVKSALFALMKRIGSADTPIARPSWKECRFCSVPATHCPVKISEPQGEVLTSEF